MKIKIELQEKTFFFLDGINITKSDGQVELDLSDRTDNVIGTVASSIAMGILKSDTAYPRIVEEIKNLDIQREIRIRLGIDHSDFQSVEEVAVEIVAVEIEESAPVEEDETAEEEVEVGAEESRSITPAILQGAAKTVATKIKAMDLSENESKVLLAMEVSGKNRAIIKKLLGA